MTLPKLPKGLWDSIFLTVQRKVLTGMSLLVIGVGFSIIGITVLALPSQDYEQVRGQICMTDNGYIFVPFDRKEL